MLPWEFQSKAERTSTTSSEEGCLAVRHRMKDQIIRLLHASEGLNTEAGEFTDAIKKHIFYGADLDVVNLEEELGDLMWYVAEACNALGIDLGLIMHKNIKKLTARYPDKFTESDALNRDLKTERDVLEADGVVCDMCEGNGVLETCAEYEFPGTPDRECLKCGGTGKRKIEDSDVLEDDGNSHHPV